MNHVMRWQFKCLTFFANFPLCLLWQTLMHVCVCVRNWTRVKMNGSTKQQQQNSATVLQLAFCNLIRIMRWKAMIIHRCACAVWRFFFCFSSKSLSSSTCADDNNPFLKNLEFMIINRCVPFKTLEELKSRTTVDQCRLWQIIVFQFIICINLARFATIFLLPNNKEIKFYLVEYFSGTRNNEYVHIAIFAFFLTPALICKSKL